MESEGRNRNLNRLLFCGLCCALTCVLAVWAIPIGPVPITLATVGVYFSGGFLGAKFGALSQLLYLVLVMIGIPVAAGGHGGLAVIFGQNGGYIIGYVLTAFTVGLLYGGLKKMIGEKLTGVVRFALMFISCVVGTIVCYTCGLIQYLFVSGSLSAAIASGAINVCIVDAILVCVVPFLIGDFLKICVVSVVVVQLERVFKQS